MRNSNLFGEEDFKEAVDGEIKQWLFEKMNNGRFTSFDGTQLQYYYVTPPESRGTIVIFHGFCEFVGKYHEMMYYMYREGYSVYFLEQRGHGHSGRINNELDLVHLKNFEDYVSDQYTFVEKVIKAYYTAPLYAFAHSMGGCVLSRFLEQHTDIFQAAILSSPMLGFQLEQTPPWQLKLMVLMAKVPALAAHIGPGQRRFSPEPAFETSSTTSRARYDYVLQQRIANPMYQTYGGTIGWGVESLKACALAMEQAGKIETPTILFQAGRDDLVSVASQKSFADSNPNIELVTYEDSKHEIFNATDEIRQSYYERLFDFLETH